MNKISNYNMNWKDWVISVVSGLLVLVQIVVCSLFPNYGEIVEVCYCGWLLLLIGTLLFLSANVLRKEGRIPNGGGYCSSTILVTSGIYSLIRHPMYTGWILFIIGLSFISQHWLSIIIGILMTILIYLAMIGEETNTIRKFGDPYKQYMQSVPRMNIILGIFWIIQRKKKKMNIEETNI